MFYMVASDKVPSVLVYDKTPAQANARASYFARAYGVPYFRVSNEVVQLLANRELLAIDSSFNDDSFLCTNCGAQASTSDTDGEFCSVDCIEDYNSLKGWYVAPEDGTMMLNHVVQS